MRRFVITGMGIVSSIGNIVTEVEADGGVICLVKGMKVAPAEAGGTCADP
jgi:hypothetical protein